MSKPRLLLVEDDPNLGDILQEYLSLKGYDATLCKDGQAGFDAFENQQFDMCVLDVMLPIMDGFTLGKKIREKDGQVPIMFLTARSFKEDKVEGFKLGGDDYMTKPFSMEELQLRIDAILRRAQQKSGAEAIPADNYDIGNYTFDPVKQLLSMADNERKLTTKESQLLDMLCQHKNRILPREKALKKIWGEDTYFTGRSMDVFITKLRKYLKEDEQVNIMNVHGQGYKLLDV